MMHRDVIINEEYLTRYEHAEFTEVPKKKYGCHP